MIKKLTFIILFTILASTAVSRVLTQCTAEEGIIEFRKKLLINEYPHFANNPYKESTEESLTEIKRILADKDRVCAIRYNDESRTDYMIQSFKNRQEMEDGYVVTHEGVCGACSTLQDLAVYLGTDLTNGARKCALKSIVTKRMAMRCFRKLGFTDQCSEIWYYNSINTREECFKICMVSWIKGEPNNKPDGTLNDCLQCDEDMSGDIFKFYSGRSRRNSGIHSEIDRPDQQVADIDQCYY